MKITNLQHKDGEGSRKSEGWNCKAGSVTQAGRKKQKKKDNIRGLSFFKAVIDYKRCKADIKEKYKNSGKDTDGIILEKKII